MQCILIDLLSYVIHKHSSRSQHVAVLNTCPYMFRQVYIIESSFFNTTSGMHRRPIEGKHLVEIVSKYSINYYACSTLYVFLESYYRNLAVLMKLEHIY